MKRLTIFLLFAAALAAQTPKFPAAIADDAHLKDLRNRAQTTLSAPLNATATSFTVVTGSKFAANMLLSIDGEILAACLVVGNTVSVGVASCPNVDGRGFDNTAAASHASGALVSANVDAWHHNAMKEEVKAIETALGVNLSNIPTPTLGSLGAAARGANSDITSLSALSTPLSAAQGGTGTASVTGVLLGAGTSPYAGVTGTALQRLRIKPNQTSTLYEFTSPARAASDDYNFPAQTPGGSIGIGANSVTLTPCPLGVAGADTKHYLYLSGGVGAAEAVLITGGTCTSGASTGTVIFTATGTHTAAWTIASATAGIQEALNVNPYTLIPPGNHHVYATITPPVGATLEGAGSGAYRSPLTLLTFHSANTKLLSLTNDSFTVRDLSLIQDAGVAAVAGNAGIYTAGSGSGVAGATADWGLIDNVTMSGFYNGLYAHGDGGSVDLNHVFIQLSVQDGAVALSSQGYWNDLIVQSSGGNGVYNGHAAPGGGYTPFFTGLQTFGNEGWGFYATNAFQLTANSFLNNDKLGEVYSAAAIGEAGYIADSYIQWAGVAYSGAPWATNNVAPGVLIDATSGPVTIHNTHFYGCQGNSIHLKAGNQTITDNRILATGQGAQAGNIYSLKIEGASGLDQIITGNNFTGPVSAATTGSVFTGNWFQGSTAAPLFYLLSGADNILADNLFFQSGGGPAYQIDAGATLQAGHNTVQAGAVVNGGALSAKSQPLFDYSAKAMSTVNPAIAALATATWTAIPLDTNVAGFSTTMHSGTVTNTRITALVAGTYLLVGQASIGPSAAGNYRLVRWFKNGATVIASGTGNLNATVPSQPTAVTTAVLAAGDYVELQAYQDSGGNLAVGGGSESATYASMQRMN